MFRNTWGGGVMLPFLQLAHMVDVLQHMGCGDVTFFDRFRRGCTVHADGNKAWKSESKRRSVKFASVSHNKMQFTKWHSKTRLTGTQALDKVWSCLVAFEKTRSQKPVQ